MLPVSQKLLYQKCIKAERPTLHDLSIAGGSSTKMREYGTWIGSLVWRVKWLCDPDLGNQKMGGTDGMGRVVTRNIKMKSS